MYAIRSYYDFQVNFALTPKGVEQEASIIEHLFSFIRLIKENGFDAWRYDEKATLLHTLYRVHEPSRPIDNVSHLSMNRNNFV